MAVKKSSAPEAPKSPEQLKQEHMDKLAVWVARNRGVQAKIAREMRPRVTVQFIHHVLVGNRKSRGGVVERRLREHGAPI